MGRYHHKLSPKRTKMLIRRIISLGLAYVRRGWRSPVIHNQHRALVALQPRDAWQFTPRGTATFPSSDNEARRTRCKNVRSPA